jgi:hypothetical protein
MLPLIVSLRVIEIPAIRFLTLFPPGEEKQTTPEELFLKAPYCAATVVIIPP